MLLHFLLSAQGREESRFGLSIHGGLFPEFTLNGEQFSKSSIAETAPEGTNRFLEVREQITLSTERGLV